jgi:tRNA A-37 threonylcarbamoyl transferase component Bud32
MNGSDVIAGRFEILGPLARGNMGEVHRARDLQTGETVAVKMILRRRTGEAVSLTEGDKNAARFMREVRIMSRLSSPNLPRTVAGGIDDDLPYLAMEYLEGTTLAWLLDENGRLPVPWAAAIGAQIATGLAAAHRAGVVHRDLKPSNVMVTTGGVVKVLDFGVGLILDDVDGARLTSSDVTVGTARYMAPEQARQSPITGAADLYALGCVLYEMLAGAPPFDGTTTYELLNQHAVQEPTPVTTVRSEVPAELDALISQLLEKDPANRPADAAEVAEVLRPIALAAPAAAGAADDPTLPLRAEEAAASVPARDEPAALVRATSGELRSAPDGGFDIFDVHRRLISDYRGFTEGAAVIRDDRIAAFMERDLDAKSQWPDPWLSLNPFFADGGSVTDLTDSGVLHPECKRIFQSGKTEGSPVCDGQPIRFYWHQREAIEAARSGASYVLTTGTGSGKSLAYIVPIVDRVLRAKETQPRPRVRAIIVYPMNALANSQQGELEKFLRDGFPAGHEPVTFARYTGQEDETERDRIRANPPDILLTNYVMLELMLTRPDDRRSLIRMAAGLEFLVFDELHTYRGRQGADVAMLIRRVKDDCAVPGVQCVGTSATMSTEGTTDDQRQVVAEVASQIFGTTVKPEHVIGETLVRATATDPGPVTRQRIAAPVAPADYVDLAADPLASWIETTFGLERDGDGRWVRRPPETVQHAAQLLAGQTGADPPECEKALERTLRAGSRARHPDTGRPLFAFRLHQFLSKGDTVHVTLEEESTRHITRDYQIEQPGSGGKILLPLAFCRECGQEYLVVWRRDQAGSVSYLPRRDATAASDDSDGYLYISSDMPWPRDEQTVIADRRVPESWLEVSARTGEDVIKPGARKYLPQPVTVDVYGHERPPAGGIEAAFIPAPFRFCLRCGVSYEQVRGQDFAKLATLDTEGRSSATSLISASILRSLESVPEQDLDRQARKLLTFVDNRQDASLQAGHFNDFVQVTMLRGALYQAAREAVGRGEEGLYYDDIATRVTRALGLGFAEYAREPGEEPAMRRRTDAALRDVVNLRVYLDLERGWRVTMPNLEQAGLLRIGYLGLDEAAAREDLWDVAAAPLRTVAPEVRATICAVLLDEMRRSLAIDVECFAEDELDRIQRRSQGSLRDEWIVTKDDEPTVATVFARAGRPGSPREHVNMSGRGKVGRYLKRAGRFSGHLGVITSDDAQQIIADLLRALARAGLVTEVEDPRRRGTKGYRVRATALMWRPGDGTAGADDPLSRTFNGAARPRVNPYFVRLYRDVAGTLAGLTAREHTAQVHPKIREQREEEFRTAELKLLYCSPTMELGVDIAGLNAVAMRNVPPTPANYAQRSGRAGRSGQPALVTTYCATGNSHDQYYFRKSRQMVAGSVAPPRLDLLNEDLIRSHVHAIWLAEVGLKLGRAIPQTIGMSGTEPEGRRRPDPPLPLLHDVARAIASPDAARRAIARASAVLRELGDDLRDRTSWWDPGWVEQVVRAAPAAFDHAFDRWRDLFRAALIDQWEQNRRRLDHSLSQKDRDGAARRRREAETQLTLLLNEDSDSRNLISDFNPYRYLASEGFLPGYSFPRLPIAAYISVRGRYGADGDYVQRPRFLAIREFGPRALIYHEGSRYEVNRIQLPPDSAGEVVTGQARRCGGCGHHSEVAPGIDNCEMCDAALGETTYGLLHLHTVFTRPRERISSDEEERRRAGFRIVTSYNFQRHGDRPGRLDAIVRDAGEDTVARLTYGDSATVRRTNLGPARRPVTEPDGFWLDPFTGRWLTEAQAGQAADDDGDQARQRIRVIPYVQDRRNILVLQLATPVDVETALSVMYALERGIEAAFQLEDSELGSELLPPDDGPRDRMLFTESAEGGAGVLRRLHAETHALARAAREALRIAHFDPETGADRGGVDPAHPCARGCYDCLLSYGNQLVHPLIDRHRAVGLLMALAGAAALPAGSGRSRTEQSIALIAQADSSLEAGFVQWLKDHGHRLPDEAQTLVEQASARPDFIYRLPGGPVAVFVDGPVHDDETIAERDARAGERLEDAGWYVIRVRYDDDWRELVGANPTVFGTGR